MSAFDLPPEMAGDGMAAPRPELSSLESEACLMGACLLDNASFDRVSDILLPEHFSDPLNRAVFTELARQLCAGKAADVVTVFEGLDGRVSLASLNEMAQYVPSAANARRHAEIVVERYKARQLLSISGEVFDLAHDTSRPIAERVEQAQSRLASLAQDAPRDEWVSAYEGMVAHTALLEERADGKVRAWPTGLADLDDYLEGGLLPGKLVVIGARPAHGKTALAMSIGLHMAQDYSVGMMSMEMPHRDVRDRMTAILGGVPLSSVIRPNRGDGLNWTDVIAGAERARNLNFYVSDEPGARMTIHRLRAKARNLKRLHSLNVLLVDYVGLMAGVDSKQSRAYQIEEITTGLKSLAKELDIVVIALAQLNREIEKRVNRRPMLSDFRDSGSFEQDADVVLGLHREAADKPDIGGDWTNYAELSVLKNRQGRTGAMGLFYDGPKTKFSNWGGPAPQRSIQAPARASSLKSRGLS